MNLAARARFEHYAAQRSRLAPPGYGVEALPHLSRLIPHASDSEGCVVFARLPAARADALIAAEVAHFAHLGLPFEWKWHAFDEPADLPARLQRHGFRADEPEALMVLDTRSPAAEAVASAAPDIGIAIRRVGEGVDASRGVHEAVRLQEQVWGRSFPSLEADLLAAFSDAATSIALYLAVAGARVVGSGWRVGAAGATSADLHGGALLPGWRGRGVYSALLGARVHSARMDGIETLHVDAAKMSRPILERKGFEFICDTVPYHRQPA